MLKKSEVVQELLDSYYFHNKKTTNHEIIKKAHQIILYLEKEELKLNIDKDTHVYCTKCLYGGSLKD